MNDRIKLAEAMGRQRHEWEWISCSSGGLQQCKHCDASYCCPPWNLAKLNKTQIFCDNDKLPDPFTDANDDYAVLEWMREERRELSDPEWNGPWHEFSKELNHSAWYRIGDYARAALKVLE